MKAKKDNGEDAAHETTGLAPDRMEDAFDALAAGLPALDFGQIGAFVEGMRLFPASGKRMILKRFVSGDAAHAALAYYILAEYGEGVVDDLNAIVFDASQENGVKVRADELLAELGSPIDREVLETSVGDPDVLRRASPWQAARDLERGDVEAGAARLGDLDPRARAVVIHRVTQKGAAQALPLLEKICEADDGAAEAVVSALSQFPDEKAVGLLIRLGESGPRSVQKAARRALHSMRTSGFAVPDDTAHPRTDGKAENGAREEDIEEHGALPLYKSVVVFSPDRCLAVVNVARQYPNGRLQALTTVVDFWKRGIRGARYWVDMSKSRFRRLLADRTPGGTQMEEVPLEESRSIVARGVRVAREVGTPIPFDLQAGKHVLSGVMAEAEAICDVFLCSVCHEALPADMVQKIKDAAPYEQVMVETRCEKCRKDTVGL